MTWGLSEKQYKVLGTFWTLTKCKLSLCVLSLTPGGGATDGQSPVPMSASPQVWPACGVPWAERRWRYRAKSGESTRQGMRRDQLFESGFWHIMAMWLWTLSFKSANGISNVFSSESSIHGTHCHQWGKFLNFFNFILLLFSQSLLIHPLLPSSPHKDPL